MKKIARHALLGVMMACAAGAGFVTYDLVTSDIVVHETYLDPSDRAPVPPVKVEPPTATTPAWKV